jgi:hypothetical protein
VRRRSKERAILRSKGNTQRKWKKQSKRLKKKQKRMKMELRRDQVEPLKDLAGSWQ